MRLKSIENFIPTRPGKKSVVLDKGFVTTVKLNTRAYQMDEFGLYWEVNLLIVNKNALSHPIEIRLIHSFDKGDGREDWLISFSDDASNGPNGELKHVPYQDAAIHILDRILKEIPSIDLDSDEGFEDAIYRITKVFFKNGFRW